MDNLDKVFEYNIYCMKNTSPSIEYSTNTSIEYSTNTSIEHSNTKTVVI